MQILLVEDDLPLGAALRDALTHAGFRCVWVRRLVEARAIAFAPDSEQTAIVLDINLPDGEGFALLAEVRGSQKQLPILVITARDAIEDRLRGLNGGADDYIIKPFAVAELLARLGAVLRRFAGFASEIWTLGPLLIDVSQRRVSCENSEVALTQREFDLLVELARCSGRVVTRDALMQRVWGHGCDVTSAALDYQIHALRKKVRPVRIHTVRGVGYLLPS